MGGGTGFDPQTSKLGANFKHKPYSVAKNCKGESNCNMKDMNRNRGYLLLAEVQRLLRPILKLIEFIS